jgi:AraC-like DNA-binding protein
MIVTGRITFHRFALEGLDAMTASTDRSYPRHTHDQYGIGVVDAGGHSSWSGRGQVEAGPGTLICLNPGEVTDGSGVGRRPRSWRMLYIDPALLNAAYLEVRGGADASFTFEQPVFTDAEVRGCLDHLLSLTGGCGACDAMACETALLRLVSRLERHSTSKPVRLPGANPGIRAIRRRIDADPAAPLTLAQLADEAGISRYQLIRGFVAGVGLTPHAYIVQQRILLARRLIRAGVGLAESAVTAGFCDQSHMTRCFTRQFGVSPRRYASATLGPARR